jgi:hypothetical protein
LFSTTSTTTSVTASTLSMTSTVTTEQGYGYTSTPSFNLNSPACQYPLNPYVCNEGPPVTIVGTFFNDSSCLTVFGTIVTPTAIPQQETFVIWFYSQGARNHRTVPKIIPSNTLVQIYGYVYPDWPAGAPFPPYPFQTTVCGGIPVASIPPYFQAGG